MEMLMFQLVVQYAFRLRGLSWHLSHLTSVNFPQETTSV